MLYAYGDESHDETKQRVFAVGAVVGAEEQWQWLDRRWTERTSGIPFHANECDSNQGYFAQFKNKDNKSLYADLIHVLVDSGMGGYACVIDLIAQREVFPEAVDMSYYKAFSETVEHMKNCAHYNGQVIKYIFDFREESTFNAALMFRMMKAIPGWSEHMGELTFDCARDSVRVQAGDLFVREVMKAWDNRIGPVKRPMRKSWAVLHETARFHGEVLGLAWFSSLQRGMPAMEKKLNMSMQTYCGWLKQRNLDCDNISNRLMYIDWLDKRERKGNPAKWGSKTFDDAACPMSRGFRDMGTTVVKKQNGSDTNVRPTRFLLWPTTDDRRPKTVFAGCARENLSTYLRPCRRGRRALPVLPSSPAAR